MSIRITASVDPASSHVEARTDSGQVIAMDADPPEGEGMAAGPKEALLAALAGCTSMDVASILRKKRQSATVYEIEVSGESATSHPRVFTSIDVEHRVSGDVSADALRRAIELSATRYCPINAMLSAVATIQHRYVLTGTDGVRRDARVVICGPAGSSVP